MVRTPNTLKYINKNDWELWREWSHQECPYEANAALFVCCIWILGSSPEIGFRQCHKSSFTVSMFHFYSITLDSFSPTRFCFGLILEEDIIVNFKIEAFIISWQCVWQPGCSRVPHFISNMSLYQPKRGPYFRVLPAVSTVNFQSLEQTFRSALLGFRLFANTSLERLRLEFLTGCEFFGLT